jgi:hypothetical protein
MAKLHGITVRPQSKRHLSTNDPGAELARGLRGLGGGIRLPGFGGLRVGGSYRTMFRVQTRYFYDRTIVQLTLNQMLYGGLVRASSRVRDHARRSIQPVGRARPMLAIQRQNPGVPLTQLTGLPMTNRTRIALITRIAEIQMGRNLSSPAGTPPYTHVPFSHMLGFRRNLQYGYDPTTHSGLAGPDRRGRQWDLPALHEFGGRLLMRRWVWTPVPVPSGNFTPIVRWFREGFPPRGPRRGQWLPMPMTRRFPYPARSFMGAAMRTAIASGEIQAAFAGTFGTRVTR